MKKMQLVTSMTLIICNNTYNVQMYNLSSDTRQSLDSDILYLSNIQFHITLFLLRETNGDTVREYCPKKTPKHSRKIKSCRFGSDIYGYSFRGCPSPCNFSFWLFSLLYASPYIVLYRIRLMV